MAILASDSGGGDYTPVPQGTHLAICNLVADLGKQEVTYDGQVSIKHQIYIRWELPDERINWTVDGVEKEGPMQIGRTYSLSLHAKSGLRADLQAWRGKAFTADELKGFDVANLLGKCCMLNVTHNEKQGKTYANIASVSGVPKSVNKPTAPENPALLYDDDNMSAFADLPQWLRDKIAKRVQTPPPAGNGAGSHMDDLDDDVPF